MGLRHGGAGNTCCSLVGTRINTWENDGTETQAEALCRPETTGNQIKGIKNPEGDEVKNRRRKMPEVTGVTEI